MSKSKHRGKQQPANTDERSLWVNVILRAINDAMTGGDTNISGKNSDLIRQQSRTWLRPTNPDFIEVCSLAGLDPEATYEKAQAAIARYDALISIGMNADKSRRRISPNTFNNFASRG